MPRHAYAGVCALLAVVVAGCERPRAPVNGLAGFKLAETTLASVQSKSLACHEGDDYTRCWVSSQQAILGQVPQIELDFAGKTPGAVLAEILMEVPGCQLGEIESWFADRLGKPAKKSERHLIWKKKYIFLRIDHLPPARCHIKAVSPSDSARVKKLED